MPSTLCMCCKCLNLGPLEDVHAWKIVLTYIALTLPVGWYEHIPHFATTACFFFKFFYSSLDYNWNHITEISDILENFCLILKIVNVKMLMLITLMQV